MDEINSVSNQNLHQLMRLMTDVAALKTDPVVQRQTLVDGLQALFKSKIGWVGIMDNWRPNGRVVIVHQILTSQVTPHWLQYMSDFTVNNPMEADPYADHSTRSDEMIQLWRRKDVLPDKAAEEKYAACVVMINKMELGDGFITGYRGGVNGDRIAGFSMHRDRSDPAFTEQEFALGRLAIEEIRELEQRGHLEFRTGSDTELPPRLAQILDRLLNGKPAKEIAADLNLSIHTVREHFQRLYQRYNVTTREALTAKFLR